MAMAVKVSIKERRAAVRRIRIGYHKKLSGSLVSSGKANTV